MRTVFSGGRLFDGTGSTVADADVVVQDGLVLDVGAGLDGDVEVDASGCTLLPGLFDCHTHVTTSHLDYWKELQTPFSYRFFEAARNLEATLKVGITTIRDAAGADLGVKQALEDGLIAGPRMQIAIGMISQTGGHGDNWLPSGVVSGLESYPGFPRTVVDGPDGLRTTVRELVRAGADVIKVATTGGVLSPRDSPRHAHFRDDELEVIVSEATAAGIFVMAHASNEQGIRAAIRAGIRSIEHGDDLDDETIDMMLEHGTYLVPTLISSQGIIDAAAAGVALPDGSLGKIEALVDMHRESIRRAAAAGVKIAMGTDSGVTPHGQNLRELVLMRELGMTPESVLRAATTAAAELMGLDGELGSLVPGKRADLVMVEGDALAFESLQDRIVAVYKDGRCVVRDGYLSRQEESSTLPSNDG